MKIVSLFAILNILVVSNLVCAQTTTHSPFKLPQKQTPPVPTVAAFEKYGNIPVNMASGVPQVGVPIATLKVKDFEWPVSLSYHAGGVRPSDIATSVGLSWVLNAGGVLNEPPITNYNLGEVPYNLNLNHLNYNSSTGDFCYPLNEIDVNVANEILSNGGTTGVPMGTISTPLFSVKYLFESGATLPASNKKINAGILTDEQGNKYEFTTMCLNQPVSNCNFIVNNSMQNPQSIQNRISYYLTRVITYNNDTIHFKYSNENWGYKKAPLLMYRRNSNYDIVNQLNYCGPLAPEDIVCQNELAAQDKRLNEIETSTGDIIRFFYASRNDLPGSSRLIKVQVIKKQNGVESVLKNIYLQQSYFGNSTVAEELRLRLDEVRFHDKNDQYVNGYSFAYSDLPLPSRLSPDYEIFENSYQGVRQINAKVNISLAGSLRRIQYPTGGETIFSYEVLRGMGKLRVKKIIDYSNENGIINERNYEYSLGDTEYYEGVFSKIESYTNIVTIPGQPSTYLVITCSKDYWQNEPISTNEEADLVDRKYSPFVTEYYGSTGKYGKIEYHYEMPSRGVQDVIIADPVLKKKMLFEKINNNYVLVQETENTYTLPNESIIFGGPTYPYSTSPLETNIWVKNIKQFSEQVLLPNPLITDDKVISCPAYGQYNYRVTSAPIRLTKTVEKLYSKENLGTFTTNTTDYFFDDLTNLNPSRVEVTNSKGEKLTTKNWYPTLGVLPSGYSPTTSEQTAINFLKNSNNIGMPYYTETFTGNALTGKKVNSFQLIGTGKAQLIAEKVFPTGTAASKESKIVSYNSKNNPVEIEDASGIRTTILYNTVTQNPIAAVFNAANNQIAYTGFELNETQTFTTLPMQRVTNGIAGSYSYSLSNGSISKSGLPTGNYTVSCWGRNGSVIINGSGVGASLTINGWSLFTSTLNTTQVTISGTAQIDELRVLPALAGMKSYSYDLFGITSITNEQNSISYFEYDATGKMIRTRDQRNNILKEVEFKYIDHKANWQSTGLTRCKPCELNQNYTSSIQEVQEKDNNPLSTTYNQLRWIDYGATASNCGLGDFQNTNTYRCATYISEGQTRNSGWRERMKQDMNPCSPTFNQSVWVLSHADVQGCQPPFVFAKFSVVPVSINYNETYADFKVDFFSDYECTIPVSVTNLSVNFMYTDVNWAWYSGTTTTQSNQITVVCNGTSTVLAAGFLLNYVEWGPDWEDLNNPNPRITSSYYRTYIKLEGAMYDIGKH